MLDKVIEVIICIVVFLFFGWIGVLVGDEWIFGILTGLLCVLIYLAIKILIAVKSLKKDNNKKE